MVITDHHECAASIPDAIAAVDPKRPDCQSPAKYLAGVGVAFKLVCAVEGVGHTIELLDEYSDLVAAGTIADVMPVVGENRVFIKYGIENIRTGKRPGMRELCAAAGLDGKRVSVTNIGYMIAPRINAAGRVGNTDTAVRLLLTKDSVEAGELALELCALNKKRQQIESEIFSEAQEMIKDMGTEGKPIILACDHWHQGVAGIVASRITDKYNVPAVMICIMDGYGHGSCRSVEGYNMHEALTSCKDLLENFGGHEMAAGLTVKEENIAALREALIAGYDGSKQKNKERCLNIDFEVIKPELMSIGNIDAMEMLEPYGNGNPQPLLCMKDVMVENVMPLSDGKHTKMWVSKGGDVFESVFFSHSIKDLGTRVGIKADVAFMPQINEFRGRRSVQLYLVDFVPREE
jgi:single-stranded-DNA-specific exonuclease